ncbi:axin-1-like [Stegodyphus dumicola]|uniref:axin-1-like n=1 Tax=Stegodyphus dumicola TaxID=202533 RepID=UPI0015AAB8B3|nr:axin-1-like [Stegodyphus dumicola]XP_035227017.1 axin-1-like [Stegodyphus dumicola]
MNGTAEFLSPASKWLSSPRPPAVGEEDKNFHDTSQWFLESPKNFSYNMEEREPPCGGGDNSPNHPGTPETSGSLQQTKQSVENSPNPSPPPPLKWAQSLSCLLEDIQGVTLFREFLLQEGLNQKGLLFLIACRGMGAVANDKEKRIKVVTMLYEKNVKLFHEITDETKKEIERKLSTNTDIDDTIFDDAQREVEAYIMKTTYPNFLSSDIYLQYLGGLQNQSSAEKDNIVSSDHGELLPTVHEDSELQISSNSKILIEKDFWQKNKISSSKLRLDGQSGLYLKSPYGNYSSYHSKYGSFLPASAQDSELQSLSSDAQTDDTMSVTDGSTVDCPTYSKSRQKRQQKALKHSAALNKDRLSHSTFIPRTQRLLEQKLSEEEFHAILVKKLNKVLEEQKHNQKVSEKLKAIEEPESSKPEVTSIQKGSHKNSAPPVLDTAFFISPSEDNVQDILDKHVSRVFKDSCQQTPTLSPGCMSPLTHEPSPLTREASERSRVRWPYDPSLQESVGTGFKMGQGYLRHGKDQDTNSVEPIPDEFLDSQSRRSREQAKRLFIKQKLSAMTDSRSSFFDSGISACEPNPSNSKVTRWLESKRYTSDAEREVHWKNSSTSPVLSRTSSSQKDIIYNCSRPAPLNYGNSSWTCIATQITPDPSAPLMPPSDTTTNLLEARRRLEDESRAKMGKIKMKSKLCESVDESYRRQSKRYPSNPMEGPSSTGSSEYTAIGYSYGRHSVPYLSKFRGKNITLRQFKSILSKKGNFRYFFKKANDDFGTGVVFEEITEDHDILPLWEGKVFCVIESEDNNSTM